MRKALIKSYIQYWWFCLPKLKISKHSSLKKAIRKRMIFRKNGISIEKQKEIGVF